jgi:hypothetical protein
MDADRQDAVASILFEYVKSPSLRHLRDPHSVHGLAREIVKALDGASSAWKKWGTQREEVANAAAPCRIPVEDIQAFLNTLPGSSLTKTDVEQRLRAIWEEPCASYPNDDLKDGCIPAIDRNHHQSGERERTFRAATDQSDLIMLQRDSSYRHIDARTGGQGAAENRKVSGHVEARATLRKLRAV